MKNTANHINSMEQVINLFQEKLLIKSYNKRVNKSIRINQLICEDIPTIKTLHQILSLLNYVHARVKKPSDTPTRCPSLPNSVLKYIY